MSSISVGIPAYNNGDTLDRAVRSVLSQSHEDWSLVISDDGSGDQTRDIAHALAAEDQRIRFIEQPSNLGFMNFGALLQRADTPYFAWLAGDDFWGPDFLATSLAALETDPKAVSAMPGCTFADDKPDPDTSTLAGPDRRHQFLAAPNGSRMYGLFRTEILRGAFPNRPMYAYDYYLMLGVLKRGAQLGVQGTQLFRERTPWRAYARMADTVYRSQFFRRNPLLDMSFWALITGRIPLRWQSLTTLLHMNRCKHEEYLFVTDPEAFAARMPRFHRLGLPLASDSPTYISRAKELLPAPSGLSILDIATGLGDAEAAIAAAKHFADRDEAETAHIWLQKSAALGHPDSTAHMIQIGHDPAVPFSHDEALQLAASAQNGSSVALSLLARAPSSIPAAQQSAAFEAVQIAVANSTDNAFRAAAAFYEHGIGTRVDLPRAIDNYTRAAATNPWVWRDAARLAHQLNDLDLHKANLAKAAGAGSGWSAMDLADLSEDGAKRTGWLAKAAASEEAQRDDALRASLDPAFAALSEDNCLNEAGRWLAQLHDKQPDWHNAPTDVIRRELAALGFCPAGHSFTGKRLMRLITESVS